MNSSTRFALFAKEKSVEVDRLSFNQDDVQRLLIRLIFGSDIKSWMPDVSSAYHQPLYIILIELIFGSDI